MLSTAAVLDRHGNLVCIPCKLLKIFFRRRMLQLRGNLFHFLFAVNHDAMLLSSCARHWQRAQAMCVSTALPMYFFCSVLVPTRM